MKAHQVYIPRENISRIQFREGIETTSENEIKTFMVFMEPSIDASFFRIRRPQNKFSRVQMTFTCLKRSKPSSYIVHSMPKVELLSCQAKYSASHSLP
ncbi:polyamine-modulated factor 1-binding protein [Trifolium repens]|nr:polyamine-modulated factor 1-binding protein [Trifolium repens]